MYVCMHARVCMCRYVHVCMFSCAYVCKYVSVYTNVYACVYVFVSTCMCVCMHVCMYVHVLSVHTCIYIYIYHIAHPPTVDRPCPCDSVLLAGDSAEILYLNTHHTTIICIVDIQRVLLTCHVLRTHAPDSRHMS